MEESKMVLRTEDLVKKYGKRTVVSHVSIDVKQGEIVGLLGPNGAGKTLNAVSDQVHHEVRHPEG